MAVRRPWQRRPLVGLIVLLALVLAAYLVGRGPPADGGTLPVVSTTELPAEVSATLDLIDRNGPFPHEQDGATFFNREALLPEQPAGYYREFTVPTPDEDDRGPRRLVVGWDGEVYFTADHYDSFVRVLDP